MNQKTVAYLQALGYEMAPNSLYSNRVTDEPGWNFVPPGTKQTEDMEYLGTLAYVWESVTTGSYTRQLQVVTARSAIRRQRCACRGINPNSCPLCASARK